MREDEIIAQLINEIEAATASDVDVRSEGGDQDVDPPEIILDWNIRRLPQFNGHRNFGAYTTDDSGNKTGIEHHEYFRITVDCKLRYYSELDRDTTLDSLHDTFMPYRYNSGNFDPDTTLWEIGTANPTPNALLEPDWYEVIFRLKFVFVKRVQDTSYDTLETIQRDVTVDDTLEDSSTN